MNISLGIHVFHSFVVTSAHALLSMNQKTKINGGLPDDNIPRLVNWAARTKEGVDTMLNALEERPLDAEYIALLHGVQSEEIQSYLYRGYTILTKGDQNNSPNKALCMARATKRYDSNELPVVWLFSGTFFRSIYRIYPKAIFEKSHDTWPIA